MERLTRITKCPDGTNIYDFSEDAAKRYITDHESGVRALFEKLAQYEDTDLTPEQIKEFPSAVELAEIATGLMELQKYREIGTVKECRGAVGREKSKTIIPVGYNIQIGTRTGRCPECNGAPLRESDCIYCPDCGQKLDWSVENE